VVWVVQAGSCLGFRVVDVKFARHRVRRTLTIPASESEDPNAERAIIAKIRVLQGRAFLRPRAGGNGRHGDLLTPQLTGVVYAQGRCGIFLPETRQREPCTGSSEVLSRNRASRELTTEEIHNVSRLLERWVSYAEALR